MKKLLILAVISTCAFAGWRVLRGGGGGGEPAASDGGGLVLDRVWIDHMPKHDRDQVSVFAAITQEPIGVFQTASAWKGHFELFRYEAHGDEIRIVYPQDNDRERVKARARACGEDGFDYCLELKGASRGVKRYYSRKGWEIDGAARPDEIRARAEALLHAK
jgi:hypothetical protein